MNGIKKEFPHLVKSFVAGPGDLGKGEQDSTKKGRESLYEGNAYKVTRVQKKGNQKRECTS